MLHVGPLNGSKQANCPTVTSSTDPNYGMIECNWTPSYTLTVPTTWTPGVYVVKLTRLGGTQLQNYMTFVVRDDSNPAPVLYSLDTNTWQAYNYWAGSGNNNVGINLYGRIDDVTQRFISDSPRIHGLLRSAVRGSGLGRRRRKLLRLGLPDDPVDGVAGL